MLTPLAKAADAARTSLRSLLSAREIEDVNVSTETSSEQTLDDEANWLDLNHEEQVAFDEKLSAFLDLKVENKERDWFLSND